MRAYFLSSIARACAALLIVGATSAAHSSGLTGTYVARSGNQAFVLQVVETGSQLTGRYEEFVAKPGGKFDDETFAFSAAVDGDRFAGTIKNTGILGATIPVSGEARADVLHLEGNSTFHVDMKRGDIADFRASVARMKGVASVAQREAAVGTLTARIEDFEAKLAKATARLPAMETHVVADTAHMSSGLDKELAIHGDGQRTVARTQISLAIQRVRLDASQVRNAVDTDLLLLHGTSEQLVKEAALAHLSCASNPASAPPLATCRRFLEVDSTLAKRIEEGKAAFAHFDEVWDRENASQVAIQKRADAAAD
jgi:hypothetical protein